ncbi:MAG: MBL fold metallo-hydrolase [Pseudomonadota bacterium]
MTPQRRPWARLSAVAPANPKLVAAGMVVCCLCFLSGCSPAAPVSPGTTVATDAAPIAPDACGSTPGLALQILGSGGPIADDARAGTGYLVWHDGRSRFLVDLGSGTLPRFGRAGGSFDELEVVALSHFHTDHSAELPGLLKSGYFSRRARPLTISGPTGSDPFPDLATFLERLIGKDGAYAYLSGYLDGSGGLVPLHQRTMDAAKDQPGNVFVQDETTLSALGVPHGIVPALAYRLEINSKRIVFASDQNGGSDAFIAFARDADVLVMHLVVPENIRGAGRRLHAPPSRIGQIAAAAGADTLVLSHFMARSLRELDRNVALVRESFKGDVVLADDLLCVPF